MEKRECCFVGCGKPATFEIYDENERRPDCACTDACDDHVGRLLGSVPPTNPIGPWRVIAIEDRHASDCATHNGPALPEGPCDCGFG